MGGSCTKSNDVIAFQNKMRKLFQFLCTQLECPLEKVRQKRLDTLRARELREARAKDAQERRKALEESRTQRYAEELRIRQNNFKKPTVRSSGDAAARSRHAHEVNERKKQLDEEHNYQITSAIEAKNAKGNARKIKSYSLNRGNNLRLQEEAQMRREILNEAQQYERETAVTLKEKNSELRVKQQQELKKMKSHELKVKWKELQEKVLARKNEMLKNKTAEIETDMAVKEMKMKLLRDGVMACLPQEYKLKKKVRAPVTKVEEPANVEPDIKLLSETDFNKYCDTVTNKLRNWSAERRKYLEFKMKQEQLEKSRFPKPLSKKMEVSKFPEEWDVWENETRSKVKPLPRWQIREAQQQILSSPQLLHWHKNFY